MKVLFDTNVLLDVLLEREPHVVVASQLVASVERLEVTGIIVATSLTTIDYLVKKAAGRERARDVVKALLRLFTVASVDRSVLEFASASAFLDFEDAVLHEAGRMAGADVLVTRNSADFKAGSLLVHSPSDLASLLQRGRNGPFTSQP